MAIQHRTTILAAAALVASALTLTSPGPASAEGEDLVTSAIVKGDVATLTLNFSEPAEASEALLDLEDSLGEITDYELVGDELVVEGDKPNAAPLAARLPVPSGYSNIYCDNSYSFSDLNGQFHIQRACGTKKAPWAFTISNGVQDIIVGVVNERGMQWILNGVVKPMMSPHLGYPKNYTFHGTFSPGQGDRVNYNDLFTFRHNVGSGGNGELRIEGKMFFNCRDGC